MIDIDKPPASNYCRTLIGAIERWEALWKRCGPSPDIIRKEIFVSISNLLVGEKTMPKVIAVQNGNEILNNIFYKLKAKGVRQKDLAEYLGISENAITQWKTRKTSSYLKHIDQLAEYFGVSPQELLSPEKELLYTSLLSPDEIQIIQDFRKIENESIKKSIEQMISTFANDVQIIPAQTSTS